MVHVDLKKTAIQWSLPWIISSMETWTRRASGAERRLESLDQRALLLLESTMHAQVWWWWKMYTLKHGLILPIAYRMQVWRFRLDSQDFQEGNYKNYHCKPYNDIVTNQMCRLLVIWIRALARSSGMRYKKDTSSMNLSTSPLVYTIIDASFEDPKLCTLSYLSPFGPITFILYQYQSYFHTTFSCILVLSFQCTTRQNINKQDCIQHVNARADAHLQYSCGVMCRFCVYCLDAPIIISAAAPRKAESDSLQAIAHTHDLRKWTLQWNHTDFLLFIISFLFYTGCWQWN